MSKALRVLVVSDVSAEEVHGGAERMLVHHLRALKDQGHEVTMLTRQPQTEEPLIIHLDNGIIEYRLPYEGSRGPAGLKQLRQGATAWWREHGGAFDVVVAEQPFTIWALLKAGCKLPRLQVCHSFAFEEYATRHGRHGGLKHWLAGLAMRRLERMVYRSAAGFLVLSRFMQDRLCDFFQLHRELITIAPGGVDIPTLPVVGERETWRKALGWHGPVVMTLRNLVPRTGVDLLVDAAGLLKDEIPELKWCVVGRGELMQELKAQAERLGVKDRVEFTGYLSEADVKKRLFAADIFMLPTRDLEGFGLVTIEANACGLPVVATPVTANIEVVPSLPFNRLADAVTAEALADAVRQMLQVEYDDRSREELRSAVEKRYAWHLHDDELVKAVEALL